MKLLTNFSFVCTKQLQIFIGLQIFLCLLGCIIQSFKLFQFCNCTSWKFIYLWVCVALFTCSVQFIRIVAPLQQGLHFQDETRLRLSICVHCGNTWQSSIHCTFFSFCSSFCSSTGGSVWLLMQFQAYNQKNTIVGKKIADRERTARLCQHEQLQTVLALGDQDCLIRVFLVGYTKRKQRQAIIHII